MKYEIILAPEAEREFRGLSARERAAVRDGMAVHLQHEPQKTGKSRIKRLRGLQRPQFRLRVGDLRVFYDVAGTRVQVLAIVPKADASDWLGPAQE